MAETFTDRLLRARATALRHVVSERTNDVDQVMPTVSADVCYLMPDVTSPAAPLVTMTDRGAVEAFYADERAFMEVVDAAMVVEATSDWYTFLEAVSTTRQVSTGTLHRNEVVVLFPVADDGIIGEILLTRRPWTECYADDPPPPPTVHAFAALDSPRVRALAHHDRLLDALRTATPAAALEAFVDDAELAVFDPATETLLAGRGHEAITRRVAMVIDALDIDELTVLNRTIGDWYVFAEWVATGTARADGAPCRLRSASVLALARDGRLAGERGYARLERG